MNVLKTRLDSRSAQNKSFEIKDVEGNTIAKIELLNSNSVVMGVSIKSASYIEKPNGWTSRKRNKDGSFEND